ncbi:MAG: putative lipopolysaccharide heptosyltransferase III [Armatimonadaceae bacterium]
MRRCRLKPERADKRILIQRNGAHGDILMATPLLTALRDAYPHAHLTWLVEYKEAATVDAHPYLDELIIWDSAYWKKLLRHALYPLYLTQAARLRKLLKARQYDVFISFQPEEWGYLVAEGCGAPMRIGIFDTYREFNGDTETSANTRRYTDSFVFEDHPPHRTDQYLLPLKVLGLPDPPEKRMTMGYTVTDAAAAERLAAEMGIADTPYVTIAPMTTWSSRCWSARNFAALADALQDAGYPVVLIGSAKERLPIENVAEEMRQRPLIAAGVLSFRELAAFLDRAALVISGDTGPMHLAAAVDTPFLALFGPTPPDRFAPLSGRQRVLHHPVPCAPCYKKDCPLTGDDHHLCIRKIRVPEAIEAARELLVGATVKREASGR